MKTWMFLLSVNILLLVLGCFLEVASTLLVAMPILPMWLPDRIYGVSG
jgi:C4-dicarboxylate transporter DctM subunit